MSASVAWKANKKHESCILIRMQLFLFRLPSLRRLNGKYDTMGQKKKSIADERSHYDKSVRLETREYV